VEHVARFYSNYQSLRYVKDNLVIRVRQAPTDGELVELSERFADVLASGRIERVAALEAEPEPPQPQEPYSPRRHLRLAACVPKANNEQKPTYTRSKRAWTLSHSQATKQSNTPSRMVTRWSFHLTAAPNYTVTSAGKRLYPKS
jgi:hypothetical protein